MTPMSESVRRAPKFSRVSLIAWLFARVCLGSCFRLPGRCWSNSFPDVRAIQC